MTKNKNPNALRWILKRLKPQLGFIIMLMAVYGVYAYAGVWTALEMREAIDAAMIGEKSGIFFHGAVLIFLVALQTALGVATRRLTFRVSTRLENKITKELFEQMLKKEYGQVSRYHTGELMNLLTGDVSVITSAVATILPHIVYVAVKLAGVFIVLSSVDPLFAVFFAAAGLLVWAVSAAFKGRLKNLHKRVQASNGKVRSFYRRICVRNNMGRTEDCRQGNKLRNAYGGAVAYKSAQSACKRAFFRCAAVLFGCCVCRENYTA